MTITVDGVSTSTKRDMVITVDQASANPKMLVQYHTLDVSALSTT